MGDSATSIVTRDAECILEPDGPAWAPSGRDLRPGALLGAGEPGRNKVSSNQSVHGWWETPVAAAFTGLAGWPMSGESDDGWADACLGLC